MSGSCFVYAHELRITQNNAKGDDLMFSMRKDVFVVTVVVVGLVHCPVAKIVKELIDA
jgi:hypothetical protein